MFKSLRDKLTSWFKKPEEKKVKKPAKAKAKKEKVTKEKKQKRTKEKVSKTKAAKPEVIETQDLVTPQHAQEVKEETQELKKELEEIKEEKKGFFKKLFSKKKPETPKIEQSPTKVTETIEESPSIEEPKTINETPLPPQEELEDTKEKKPGFFAKLARRLSTSTITQEQFDEIFPDLEMTLLENNVALEVVDKIHNELSKDLVGIEVKRSEVESTIIKSLKDAISSILIDPPDLIEQIRAHPGIFTIIFVGINGSGKTTSIAKLAYLLKKNNISVVLAAGDTFRAASIEQLKTHAERLGVPLVAQDYGADPAAVAFDAKKYAQAHKIKAVLIDTAGRMYTKTNLIKEMEKIVRVSAPNLKIFVGESITGNDATLQAKTFNEAINIDGTILSKADVDEKAGTILSISQVTGKPIYFLGTGQDYPDLQPFTKSTVLKNLGLE